MISMREVSEHIPVREWIRIGDFVDKHTGVAWTRFDVLKIVRDSVGLAVQVDLGKGRVFWVVLTGDKTYFQTYSNPGWERAA
jgi:hypothetical protein